jgi:molecular chaperone DnaK (HSP70)
MPRGQAELVTTFEVDANGLLKVSAMDRASGRKASISKFLPSSTLEKAELSFRTFRHHQLRRSLVVRRDRPNDQRR